VNRHDRFRDSDILRKGVREGGPQPAAGPAIIEIEMPDS